MSLIVTTYVPEGIIIAGDSRLTINWNEEDPETKINNHYSITSTDSNRKVFQIKDKFGLATFGAADIKGIPIAGYITQFIEENIDDNTQIDDVPACLHDFFGKGLEIQQAGIAPPDGFFFLDSQQHFYLFKAYLVT